MYNTEMNSMFEQWFVVWFVYLEITNQPMAIGDCESSHLPEMVTACM